MTYVDGYVLVVPEKNLKQYKKMAQDAANVWKKHGALHYLECVADELNPDMQGMEFLPFQKLTNLKKNETVMFSFIIYKSKKHRNSVNKKVMEDIQKDPKNMNMKMPFDMKKFSYAGFKAIVEEKN